ncbi:MAG TPA: fumarylacetoacetate hydrolase family protein [Alphaproteobacteria bacterium]|nr:fumarylacetoacetate hydrolase family protein [Alphaproteobacteria bacterium]
MKFVSFLYQKKPSYGVIAGDGVFDLGKKFGKKYPTLRVALLEGALNALKKAAKGKKPNIPLAKIQFLPVIPDARKIVCVGLNYREHRAETGRPDTVHPTLFNRWADSQVGHDQPLLKPKESDKFDWEGELAVIIGKEGRRIPREKAMSYVAGYSCYNDGSVRDWQRHTSQFMPGKNFPATGGFGPWMVTTDELKDITKQTLTTRVNGVVKQQATIDMMIFDIPEQIAYISAWTTLRPGDVIVTGTPGGVGIARNPPEFMKVGDTCEIEITGVGKLRNVIKEG